MGEAIAVQATEAALNYIRQQAETDAPSPIQLRFGVTKTGCSGYAYQLEMNDQQTEQDHQVMLADDIQVLIEKTILPLLAGTTLDYVKTPFGGMMKFHNPNETGSCGCGESFTVEEPQE